MLSFYNNKPNKKVKFKMEISGVEPEKIAPRFIIESKDGTKCILVHGTINENSCYFEVPELNGFKKGEKATAYYEVVVENEQYAKLWSKEIMIESKTEIKVESTEKEDDSNIVRKKLDLSKLKVESIDLELDDEDINLPSFK